MTLEPSTVTGAVVVALSIAATGFGAGSAHADPPIPSPTPAPAPPGRDVVSVPGHSGPMPPDAVVPVWAPPAPPPPFWAPWLPVVWNSELNVWGVWWNGNFQPL